MEISGYAPFLTIKEREMPVYVATIGNPKPQTVVYRPRGISDYMFLYTLSGEGVCKSGTEEVELKVGSLLFVPPGAVHEYRMKTDVWETCYITFNGNGVVDFFKNDTVVCNIPESFGFYEKYKKIYEYKQNPKYFKETSIETYKLIINIRELINNEFSSEKKINIVEKAIKYMEKNRAFDLAAVSENMGISKEHFCRIFKQYTGYRPSEYMNILKIQKAKTLIRETDKSIGEIAVEAGFESQSYFGMLFKKHMGMTPKEYKSGNY